MRSFSLLLLITFVLSACGGGRASLIQRNGGNNLGGNQGPTGGGSGNSTNTVVTLDLQIQSIQPTPYGGTVRIFWNAIGGATRCTLGNQSMPIIVEAGATYTADINNMTISDQFTLACYNGNLLVGAKFITVQVGMAPVVDHIVFVTPGVYQGNLGGLAGADAKCAVAAGNLRPGATWKAILSDANTNASARIVQSGAVLLPNGQQVSAANGSLFDGNIDRAINVTPDGMTIATTSDDNIWTGSKSDGTRERTCNSWSTNSSSSSIKANGGRSASTNGDWLDEDDDWSSCEDEKRLYCISQ